MSVEDKQKEFYDLQYASTSYAKGLEGRGEEKPLREFIKKYDLQDKKNLEIGCGRGAFQNLVDDWTGVDIAESLRNFIKKPFYVAPCETLPFEDGGFDAIWSITTLEHVQDPEAALNEIMRVLKQNGIAYLAPAWHVRPWAAGGYEVRLYSDLDLKGKLIKASIPVRNNLFLRAVPTFIFRLIREVQFLFLKNNFKLHYKKLKPNYEKYWCADSDATCSLDQHEMLLWFKSRGWKTPSHPTFLKRFFVRHGAIIVQKPNKQNLKLALLASHPIQYQTPLYKEIAKQEEIDLKVFFCSKKGLETYKDRGFGREFKWDISLLDGYNYEFLPSFLGLINPSIIWKIKDCNAIWIHGWNSLTNWLAIFAAMIFKIPILLRGESNLLPKIHPWKRITKRIILRWLFKNISAFLAIGRYNQEFYEYYGVKKERIFLVPYTVNNDFFISKAEELLPKKIELKKKHGISQDIPIILFSGKLIDVKRAMDLLKAFEIVSKEIKSVLVFVGDGKLKKELKNYTKNKNIKNVYFMGFRNQTQLPEFYAMSDVFVLPSEHEPWGLVVNEAMCFGLPVIVSDQVGASGDLVKEHINGFIYSTGSISKLSECLKDLITNKEKISDFGKQSHEIILNWSYKECIKGVLAALKRVGN